MSRETEEKKDISQQLATAPMGRLMLKLAVPTVLAQLVNLLYNIVDRIYIGHMEGVGRLAMTGLGLCFPVICLLGAFAMLIASGGAPRAAIAMGRGDNQEAERILGNCFTCLIGVAAALTVLFQIFGERLLWLFGASDATIGFATQYMTIYSGGAIFIMMSLGMNMFITTQGFTKYGMVTVVLGAVTNIALDPVFIFALDMGVQGAALATVLSQAVSSCFVLCFLFGKRTKLRIRRENLRPRFRVMGPCLALGLAPFIMQATEAAINIAFNSSLQAYGGDPAVGMMTVASTVLQMVWLPAQGIGQGAQPIISYNYGAGNASRVRDAFWTMLKVSGVYLLAFWALIQLFPSTFIALFNDDPVLVANAGLLRVYTAVIGFFFIQMAVQQVLLSTGKAKASLFIACLRKVILLLPLIYILPNFFENKVFAVFLAEPVSDMISIITAALVYRLVVVKDLNRLERQSQEG